MGAPAILWCAVLAASAIQPDPVTGRWTGYYISLMGVENTITVELRLRDERVDGAVIAEVDRLPIENGRYSASDRSLRFEVFFYGTRQRYRVEGRIDGDAFRGTWKHDEDNGRFELKREPK